MTEKTKLAKLKEQFASAGLFNDSTILPSGIPAPKPRCSYFDEIGQLAIRGDLDALFFVVINLHHDDPSVRYAAVGFLEDMPDKYLIQAKINAVEILQALLNAEKDVLVAEHTHKAIKKIKKKHR